ncbi:MAG: wax ester/triacylglycerol synthase family O-acyltransferase [Anaerolineales bacterium]|nr:wax ester/triacylglycerol synthase family O-acyltransferase [Anaerolineales bacterium]
MASKPLSSVDLAWLRMDNPANLMVITGVITLESPLDMQRFKATIENTLLRFKRFRQRVVWPRRPWKRPYWQDDPHFNLDTHVQKVTLSPPGDQQALQDLVSELMSVELDCSRPLWQFYVIEKYGTGSALVYRLHHCIADGISLVQVLLLMADTRPDAPWPAARAWQEERSARGLLVERILQAGESLRESLAMTEKLVQRGTDLLVDPERARETLRLGADTLVAAGRLVMRWPDPQTLFKGRLGVKKRAAWSTPLLLEDVKRIGRVFGGTVNDILLSTMAGALRRYMLSRGESVDEVNIRGVVPVNLRPIELDENLGNQFGLVFLTLPVGVADPVSRLYRLKGSMDELKSSAEAVAAFGILEVLGASPARIQDVGVSIFDTKGTAVMTNVPGPRQRLYLAGAPIEMVMAWVPQSGRIGLGISFISYNEQVFVGVATDKGLAPDPERILDDFYAEFEQIKSLAEKTAVQRSDVAAPMITTLDEALRALDEVIEARQAGRGKKTGGKARCQALTRSGKRCKNPPLPGERYCRVHIKRA